MATTTRSDQPKMRHKKAQRRPSNPDREESLDRTIESTFPASDAPSSIPDPEPEPPKPKDARDSR